ncbi:sugar ABC transporter permease [Bacillus sp. FJAT-26390]|uniref:ABC transporter permease n=1 Tax=Bacillus sp. FJAT-26390 TaxID=1743142 RepID=UPI000807ED27|nr:ABC transporter permease subunit [Bacillus sp. FJAT-26390]OBZ09477.1 protein lplB [Bacillus sp. FJAT-26390]
MNASLAAKQLRRIATHRYLYIMVLPCLLFFAIFNYIPMAGLLLAFKEYKFNTTIFNSPWVGMEYFKRFFDDYQSGQLIRNTLVISCMKLLLGMPFPILLALMFNEVRSKWFRGLTQSIMYLPHFLSWVIIVGLMQRIFAPEIGIVNEVIKWFGGDGSTFFAMDAKYFYPMMFWSYIWQTIGWGSIIYYAAITGINPNLFEAAKIDGANKWQEIRYVTLPSIMPTIVIVFILSLGGIMTAGFDQLYLMRTPGNMHLSDVLDTYIIRVGIQSAQFGYATAVGLMQGLIGFVLVVLANRVTRKVSDNSLW